MLIALNHDDRVPVKDYSNALCGVINERKPFSYSGNDLTEHEPMVEIIETGTNC